MEQLVYAVRLMNVASGHGRAAALSLRDWLSESDARSDPQAYVLRPDVVYPQRPSGKRGNISPANISPGVSPNGSVITCFAPV